MRDVLDGLVADETMEKKTERMRTLINAVIFDLDGLLIDSERIYYQIEVVFLSRYGHSITMEEYSRNNSGKTLIKNVTYMVGHYHLPISVEDGLTFVMAREKEYFAQGVPLKPGAEELPRNCLVLEDSEAGIQAAYSAGIPVIGIPDMKIPDEKYQAMVITLLPSLADVSSYIADWPCQATR